jgi:hypothetical protein
MNGHGEKLTRKMNDFILVLMSTGTLDEAADAAGISSITARRWYRMDVVKAELKRLQNEVTGHSLTQLKLGISEAVTVLRNVMTDSETPPSARVSAAKTMLDGAFRAVETTDILERLEALEAGMENEK